MVFANGDLIGTTAEGGLNGFQGDGTVFEVTNVGPGAYDTSVTTTLFDFSSTFGSNGANPYSSPIVDANGDLLGTTYAGGANNDGAVYEINSDPSSDTGYASAAATVVSFNGADGATPTAGLIAAANGDLFGTTFGGGAYGDGTVFEIEPDLTSTTGYASAPITLFSFDGTDDGASPAGALVADSGGDLFGMTTAAGASGLGTVFELKRDPTTATGYASAPITLFSFDGTDGASGSYSYGGLIVDALGDLFGMTRYGGAGYEEAGADDLGTVFELPSDPTSTTGYASAPLTLVNFNGANGASPEGSLTAADDGDLFGSTR